MKIKGEKYSSPISSDLYEILMDYIDKDDRANVHASTGVSLATIQKLHRREGVLSKKNVVALRELMHIARKKCLARIAKAESDIAVIDYKLKPEE